MKQESSATDFVTDVTDVSQKEAGRSKREKARRKFDLKSETKINPKHNLADYL